MANETTTTTLAEMLSPRISRPVFVKNEQVVNRSQIAPAFQKATTERIAIVGLGDSNQGQNGYGWDHGFQYGMVANGYSMFGTGLMSAMENGGSSSSLGYKWNKPGFSVGATTGAPAGLDTFMNKGTGAIAPHNYSYGDDAASFSSNNNGFNIDADCPVDVNGTIEFRLWYGTFLTADGNGQMRIAMRRNNSPYTLLAQDSTINPSTPNAYGMTSTAISVAAGTRDYPILGQIYNSGTGVTLEGPYFHTFGILTNTDKTTGFNYSTLDYRGGQSARTVANDLQQASDDYLTHFFTAIRLPLGTTKTTVVVINEGMNDRNEGSASLGPDAVADGDSPEAFADNMQGIINRITEIYTLNSWDTSTLYFLVFPSHQITSPDDSELISYRRAAETVAINNERTASVYLDRIVSFNEMGDYYLSGGDHLHLNQTGYETLGTKIIRAIYKP